MGLEEYEYGLVVSLNAINFTDNKYKVEKMQRIRFTY